MRRAARTSVSSHTPGIGRRSRSPLPDSEEPGEMQSVTAGDMAI